MRQTFADTIKIMFTSFMENINIMIPGKIESYDHATKKVSVKPLIKKKIGNKIISYPIINNVPVNFLGSKHAILSFPLEKGDGCMIVFSQESMENYLSSKGGEVEPGDNRRFSLTDAVCIPGLFSFGDPGKIGKKDKLSIEIDNKDIVINGLNIELNGNTKKFVTYAELNTALQAFITDLNIKLTTGFAAVPYTWPGTALNISTSETQTIKTGG